VIGAFPSNKQAPLDYRYAFDAAISFLVHALPPLVWCHAHALVNEVRQRIPYQADQLPASSALWVEPIKGRWRHDLDTLVDIVEDRAPLVIVASLPLARLVPERASWNEEPLCVIPGGFGNLRRALCSKGYSRQEVYGFHSLFAIGYNILGQKMEQVGYPHIGDRMHFQGRLHYCVGENWTMTSTVALLMAKQH
jgi:hypothetical protein